MLPIPYFVNKSYIVDKNHFCRQNNFRLRKIVYEIDFFADMNYFSRQNNFWLRQNSVVDQLNSAFDRWVELVRKCRRIA